MNDLKAIGITILIIRKNMLKLSQVEASDALGMSQGYLSKIENGTLEISIRNYYRILRLFNMNSTEFEQLVQECKKQLDSAEIDHDSKIKLNKKFTDTLNVSFLDVLSKSKRKGSLRALVRKQKVDRIG